MRGKWFWRVVPVVLIMLVASWAIAQRGRPGFRPPPPVIPRVLRVTKPLPQVFAHKSPLRQSPGAPRSVVFKDLSTLSHRNPSLALDRLNRLKSGQMLSHIEQRTLVKLSLNNIGVLEHPHASGGTSSLIWHAIARTRLPGPDQHGVIPVLSADHKESMNAIRLRFEDQIVREGAGQVVKLVGRKQWSAAISAAQVWLARDREVFQVPVPPPSRQHKELRDTLTKIHAIRQDVDKATTLIADWRPTEPKSWSGFLEKHLAALPKPQVNTVKGLIALDVLRSAADEKAKPNVKVLQDKCAELRDALVHLPKPRASALVSKIQQELAVKAFLEGHVDAAHALWPKGGDVAHTRNLLRDMRALATGDGELTTPPGQAALPGGGGKPPAPPTGLAPLLPEDPGNGWRPPARGKASAGLPPLVEAAREAETLRGEVTRFMEARQLDLAPHFTPHLQRLNLQIKQFHEQDEIHRKWLHRVKKKMGDKLAPVERALALSPENMDADLEVLIKKLKDRRKLDEIDQKLELLLGYLDVRRDGKGGVLAADALKKLGIKTDAPHFMEEYILFWASPQLQEGKDLVDIASSLIDVLRTDMIESPDGIGIGIQLDLIALELHIDLDSVELAHAREKLKKNATRTDVAEWILQQRLIERRKADLERVKSYLDRAASAEELKKARELIEQGKDVAATVAGLSDALSPERRDVPGGIAEAIRLDEIAHELDSPLDAFEQERGQLLLREGRETADVAAILVLHRAEAFEAQVQRKFQQLKLTLYLSGSREQELALEWLRQGHTVTEIPKMMGR